eukprot:3399416-Rhodomonas_salina.1
MRADLDRVVVTAVLLSPRRLRLQRQRLLSHTLTLLNLSSILRRKQSRDTSVKEQREMVVSGYRGPGFVRRGTSLVGMPLMVAAQLYSASYTMPST